MSATGTLKKISFQNLEQFTEEINRNFALIENSPLYKGIPGKGGLPGMSGLRGMRGSQFMFVELTKFNMQFPGEFVNASKITLDVINSKMEIFEEKQKLLKAFDATEFVSNDVVVLTNSIMLKYDNLSDKFVDTRLAFNEQSNLVSSIELKIEDYVKNYIENTPSLHAKNIFESFVTYAKNYTDTNNSQITTTQTDSSVYVPYVPGVTNTSGIKLNDHKYYAFNDVEFPKSNRGSIIFGSLKRYVELLMATTSTAQDEVLTSDYAPGNNNIPAAVFLQDTNNAGILIGRKTDLNLKRFGSIYKDADGNLVIKSDSGVLDHEFSKLLINQVRLSYAKDVYFGSNLNIGKDLIVGGSINNPYLRTGNYADPENINSIEIGSNKLDNGDGASVKHIAENQTFPHFASKVFVLDADGKVRKDYSIESAAHVSEISNDSKKLVTSNLIVQLRNMISGVEDATGNFYTRAQFLTGDIPNLVLSQDLVVNRDANLKGALNLGTNNLIQSIRNSHQLDLGSVDNSALINLRSRNIRLGNFSNNVLVTDASGNILNTYSVNKDAGIVGTTIPNATTDNIEVIEGKNISENSMLTGSQYGWMITLFNNIKTRFKNTFNKTESDDRYLQKSDNLNSLTNKDTSLTNLGVKSIGKAILRANNPSLQGFIMVNIDGTITYRSNVEVRSDIGAAASSHQHNANDINAGILNVERLPNLDTSKVTTGQFTFDRMPRAASGFLKASSLSSNPTYAVLVANDIPSLDASKVTTGRFTIDRMPIIPNNQFMVGAVGNTVFRNLIASDIPSLDTSKITTGIFSVDRIPSLDASKINTGRFVLDRLPAGTRGVLKAGGATNSPYYELLTAGDIPDIDAGKLTTGVFHIDRIPNINANKITDGVLPVLRGGTGSNNAGNFLKDRDVNSSDFNTLNENGYYNAKSNTFYNNPFVNDATSGILLSLGIETRHQMYLHQDGGLSVRGKGENWSSWRRMYTDDYHPKISQKFNIVESGVVTSKSAYSTMNLYEIRINFFRFGKMVFITGSFGGSLNAAYNHPMFQIPDAFGKPSDIVDVIIHSAIGGANHEGGGAFINKNDNQIRFWTSGTNSDRRYQIYGMYTVDSSFINSTW